MIKNNMIVIIIKCVFVGNILKYLNCKLITINLYFVHAVLVSKLSAVRCALV